jgi:hypothetical protein
MDAMRSFFRWVGDKVTRFRELTNGDDLNDAQMHRGDYHEFKSNPTGPG